MATNENLPPNVIKQLAKELKNLDETPPEGIEVTVDDGNFSTIDAYIEGPAGTPYEDGVFLMKLILSHEFPHSPPKGYFITKIYHPNVAHNGEICVDALKRDWNPSLGLRHVLIVVRCLLIEPFPESALNEQAGKLLLENYDAYAKYARLFTGIHALKRKAKSKTGAISEPTTALNVGQTNTSVLSIDQKTAVAGDAPEVLSPLVPSTDAAVKVVIGHGQPSTVLNSVNDTGVSCSATAATGSVIQKRETGVSSKVLADKKKIDARRKSLKRL